jgi:hypothetical protein
MTRNQSANRRGLVMLMVLISLAMAVVLSTAYLVSRDNSLPLARNAVAASAGRWAALSAHETAIAILETEENWRDLGQGVLLDDFPLLGINLDADGVELPPIVRASVEAVDIETSAPPVPTTRWVRVTASATVDVDGDGSEDGRQGTQFIAYVPSILDAFAVVDLSDFVVFARKQIYLGADSRIARWPRAPLSLLGRRVHLGTNATASSSVAIMGQSACIDCTVHEPPLSSPTLVNNQNGPHIALYEMPFNYHFPEAPPPGVTFTGGRPDYVQDGGTAVISTNRTYARIELRNGAQLTLRGNITVTADENLQLMDDTDVRLFIDGHVKLVVFNDCKIRPTAAIEVLPGSTLDLFVRDDLELNDGYIGDVRTNNLRDHTGQAPWTDVSAIRLFSIDPNSDDHAWTASSNSVIKGTIYGRLVKLSLAGEVALYGRAAVESLTLDGEAAVFYDHALDYRQGYTNPDSPLYDGGLAPSTLDPALLQTLANSTSTTLRANGVNYAPPDGAPPPPPPSGTPTARPVIVESTLVVFGPDVKAWEAAAAQ